jgi:protein-S-isoprenylcysteine O-methyltransferase Ste14
MRSKKIFPPAYAALSIMVTAILHFLLPVAILIPFPWDLVGVVPVFVGIVFVAVAIKAFHRFNTTLEPYQKPSALVTNGVFRISRNPIYLGYALVLLGLAVIEGSLTPYVAVAGFVVLIDRLFISAEEQILSEQFGKAWQEYKKTTRRWI